MNAKTTIPEQALEAARQIVQQHRNDALRCAQLNNDWSLDGFLAALIGVEAALTKAILPAQSGSVVMRTEDQKDKLIEKLHVVAKNVSHALMSFTPGGSEYFTRVQVGDFEDYYADADACQRCVRERIDGAEERARDAFRSGIMQREDVARIIKTLEAGLISSSEAINAVLALPHTGQPQEGWREAALIDRSFGEGMRLALKMASQGAQEAARELAEKRIEDGRKALSAAPASPRTEGKKP